MCAGALVWATDSEVTQKAGFCRCSSEPALPFEWPLLWFTMVFGKWMFCAWILESVCLWNVWSMWAAGLVLSPQLHRYMRAVSNSQFPNFTTISLSVFLLCRVCVVFMALPLPLLKSILKSHAHEVTQGRCLHRLKVSMSVWYICIMYKFTLCFLLSAPVSLC